MRIIMRRRLRYFDDKLKYCADKNSELT